MSAHSQSHLPIASSRFEQLVDLTSRPDWDDEGGVVIDAARWEDARRLAEAVRAEVSKAPEVFFSACGDGRIHLRWADATRSLDAEVDGHVFRWAVRIAGERTRMQSERAADLLQALRALFA